MLNREEFDLIEYKYILFLKKFDKSKLGFDNQTQNFLNNNPHKFKIVQSMLNKKLLNEEYNDYNYALKFELETTISKNKKTAELSSESYIFLEHIDKIIDQISENGDLIIDKLGKRKYIKENKIPATIFPNFKHRIQITGTPKNGTLILRSHGLNKYGIPDIEALEIPKDQKHIATQLIKQTARKLLFYDKFEYNFEGYNVKLEQMHNSKGIFNKSQLRLTYAKQ